MGNFTPFKGHQHQSYYVQQSSILSSCISLLGMTAAGLTIVRPVVATIIFGMMCSHTIISL